MQKNVHITQEKMIDVEDQDSKALVKRIINKDKTCDYVVYSQVYYFLTEVSFL